MAADSHSAFTECLAALPLNRLVGHYGLSIFADGKSHKEEPCPFCKKKNKFSIHQLKKGSNEGRWVFKCFSASCHANAPLAGNDEIGLVAMMEGLPDRTAAFKRWMELAGVKFEKPPSHSGKPPASGPPEESREDRGEPECETESIDNRQAEIDNDNPWAVLHSRLTLRESDRRKLREQRGFSDETIGKLGFRSNLPGNANVIRGLIGEFPVHQLLDEGILVRDRRNDKPIPNSQFCGWGQTGDKDDKGEPLWGPVDRPLIPYHDAHGKVTWMRPHKGNIAKQDKDDDETCPSHVYSPYLPASRINDFDGLCVLTEGEFKAAALWQAGFPALAIPGTAFIRNPIFRTELVSLLDAFDVTDLVIIFDNEVKDNPELGNYKPDPWNRHWTTVWARYMAWDLSERPPRPSSLQSIRIGQLEDKLRLGDDGRDRGKIDFDTALADCVRRQKSVTHGTAKATQLFQKAIDGASIPKKFLDLFPSAAQTIISTQLNHLWYDPLLKSGGAAQEKLIRRFERIGGDSTGEIQQWAGIMVEALRSVVGTYYERIKPTDKLLVKLYKMKGKIAENIAAVERDRDAVDAEKNLARLRIERRLLTEKIEGMPSPISNFIMKCDYCLHTSEGTTDRLVSVANTQKEKSGLLRLPPESFGRLAEFCIWCLKDTKGVAVWRGGAKNLQCLQEDMKHYSAFRNIHELSHYGLHPASGIWFMGDCAIDARGGIILPDDNNIFWYEGIGYQIDASKSELGDGYQQSAPRLFQNKRGDKEMDLQGLFQRFSDSLFSTIGDYDAFLCIGTFLGYATAPELYREHGGHPGLWLFGRKGGGKTTVARALMRIWGFPDLSGTRIDRGTTAVGMSRNLNQYCFLPFWFDEYRKTIPDVDLKESVLRGAFDRSSTSKGMMDGASSNKTRAAKTLTMPLVTGENSSPDAATRSRYMHSQISKPRRLEQDPEKNDVIFQQLKKDSDYLYLIGLYLLQNRPAFLATVTHHLNLWMTRKEIPDDRTRFVHGFAYANYLALAEMLNINMNPVDFAAYTIEHANTAFDDVNDETMINKLWSDVISGLEREDISKKFFSLRTVHLDAEGRLLPENITPNGHRSVNVVMIAIQPVYDEYAADLRRRGENPSLTKNDAQREMSKESCWIEPGGVTRSHRVQINNQRFTAWVLNLAEFPFGDDLKDAIAGKSV